MHQDAPATVTRPVDAQLRISDNCSVSFPTQLHYDVKDPYAVTVTFLVDDDEEVEWVFARDLLKDGLHRQAGDGDVMVRPASQGHSAEAEVELVLAAPGGHARVMLPAETLAAFLRASHDVVPPGAEPEHLNVETAILQILSNSQ